MDASVSRLRPVMLVAVTTVLGMIPLLQDPFFVAMAATIMFGLAFACVLTMIVVRQASQHPAAGRQKQREHSEDRGRSGSSCIGPR